MFFKWLVLNFCLALSILSADFSMRVFNIGQANFVLLTKGDKALVVDCGIGHNYGGILERVTGTQISDDIRIALELVTQIGIVITHDHADHINGVNQLRVLLNSINIGRDAKRRRGDNSITNLNIAETCPGWLGTKTDVDSYIRNYFPEDEIETIRPHKFDETFLSQESGHEHENNLILIVHQYGKHILLPGDANATLFAYHCIHTEFFQEKLSEINVFLASHHGSTENGEYVWLDKVFNNDIHKRKITIISSDPNTNNFIPKQWFFNKARELSEVFITSLLHSTCLNIKINPDGEISIKG